MTSRSLLLCSLKPSPLEVPRTEAERHSCPATFLTKGVMPSPLTVRDLACRPHRCGQESTEVRCYIEGLLRAFGLRQALEALATALSRASSVGKTTKQAPGKKTSTNGIPIGQLRLRLGARPGHDDMHAQSPSGLRHPSGLLTANVKPPTRTITCSNPEG